MAEYVYNLDPKFVYWFHDRFKITPWRCQTRIPNHALPRRVKWLHGEPGDEG